MSFSEIPPPPELTPGQDEPFLRVRPPGPQSRSWLTRAAHAAAPMGPPPVVEQHAGVQARLPAGAIVYSTAKGSNVVDVDGNRYVDLAGGFGALLLGHAHPHILRVIELQSARLMQALGDVHPSEAKIALMARLAALYPGAPGRVILGQSGADAVSAALKTALLCSGKPGVIAFEASYHGLSYGPLAASSLRASYREPFAAQLNPHVRFVSYPRDTSSADLTLERVRFELSSGDVGAVLIEPILGRGGCVVPPADFLPELARLGRAAGALTIADEIWTGLGRAGKLFFSVSDTFEPDLICLGKGLGGGLPISACLGRAELMQAWQREPEVVHTSTFAGAPLACATAIATLDLLEQKKLAERAAEVGQGVLARIESELVGFPGVAEIRGAGLMLGIDFGKRPGAASVVQRALLEQGYIVSTGGGAREVVVLTPALDIEESLLQGFVDVLRRVLAASPNLTR
jgi:4-aminobutyrate aminotransferase-like enzyme